MNAVVRAGVGILALVGAVAGLGAIAFACQGISARREPSAVETQVTRFLRGLLIPAAARRRPNPLPATPQLLERAEHHFADHCAPCHGRDGRGDTEIGRGLHPRVPDLTRLSTQQLSDGELFWIIENGIRLTGMPAFGRDASEDDEHAWALAHWIRRLPELAREVEEIEREGGGAGQDRQHTPHAH